MTLKDFLLKARREGWATGHFNVSELDHIRAVVEACKELNAPAIIGTSEGERKHLGLLEAAALRDVFRKEYGIPVFLNADHSKSVEAAKFAVDAGYDSIHIDLSAKDFEENISGTIEVLNYAKSKNSEISVEGELGYLRGESKIQKEKITVSKDDYTKPEDALEFVRRTNVDRLAIVVGNIHGLSPEEPSLDINLISEIRKIIPETVALVLHGGSGIPEDQIKAAIKAGVSNIHINTDLRAAYVGELKKELNHAEEEVAMYKLDESALLAMKESVKEKLKLFGSINRI